MSPMYMAALRQAVELGQITLLDDMDFRLLAASRLVGADASGSISANSGGSAQIMSKSQAVSSAAAGVRAAKHKSSPTCLGLNPVEEKTDQTNHMNGVDRKTTNLPD